MEHVPSRRRPHHAHRPPSNRTKRPGQWRRRPIACQPVDLTLTRIARCGPRRIETAPSSDSQHPSHSGTWTDSQTPAHRAVIYLPLRFSLGQPATRSRTHERAVNTCPEGKADGRAATAGGAMRQRQLPRDGQTGSPMPACEGPAAAGLVCSFAACSGEPAGGIDQRLSSGSSSLVSRSCLTYALPQS